MQDQIVYDGRFSFNEDVAGCFDDMLGRSIPDYERMRGLVDSVGRFFVPDSGTVVAIGSSLGRDFEGFANRGANVVSCDVSEPMVRRQAERFEPFSNVDVRLCDVTEDYPKEKADLVLSVLTLQFIPVEERQRVVANMAASLNDGGAAIVVEKLLGGKAAIEDVFTAEYYRRKGEAGYTQEQITSKRKSLAGTMAPLTEAQNRDMFARNGFSVCECFWRSVNFAAFLLMR